MDPTDNSTSPDPMSGVSDDAAADFLSGLLVSGEAAPQESGEVIGPYVLLEKLGDGGFGTVWLARQELPVRREVALKIIKLGMDTLEVIARFEQERQALAMMDHPNIARVLDAGATPEGRPYFAMELVRGKSITRYCQENSLPIEARLHLFQDVCAAVQHAHQKGIIHRDLKPSNILVTEADGKPVPKIIDFGIAKATTTDRLTDYTLVTRIDQLMGTPVYMSPEQADASPDIDTRSDIYALGALLYELISTRPPFEPETLHAAGHEEMRRIIREVRPQPPSQRNPDTLSPHSKDLDLIALQALEKDRERRYGTANALGADIARFLNHEPIHARPPSNSYLLSLWLRRNWLPATAAAAISIAAIAFLWQKLEADRQASEANSMMKMLMVTTLWETNKIDYVALTKMRGVIDLTAERIDSLKDQDEGERMRICIGLGKAYYGLEDWPKAVRYIGIARDIAIRTSVTFRITREVHELHATCLFYDGQNKEALALSEELIPLFDKVLTPDDPSPIYIRILHAQALAAEGRYPESLAEFDSLFQLIEDWPNTPRPMDVVYARLYYPEILRLSGNPTAALKAARENVDLARTGLGDGDLLCADVRVMCAYECMEAGEIEEAHEYVEFAWQLYLDTYGPAHIRTREYKELLLELTDEPLEVWRSTIEALQDDNGTTAPGTLEEIDRFLTYLEKEKLQPEAQALTLTTIRNLQSPGAAAETKAHWLPKMKSHLTKSGTLPK